VQQKVSPTVLKLYLCNPLAAAFQQFRHAVVNPATPSVGSILTGPLILVPIVLTFAFFALGFVVFNQTAPYVAENL
jgi:ABC-type polysaccharide/polyol phosphate export permease